MSGELREQLQASLGHAYIIERELGSGGTARVLRVVLHRATQGDVDRRLPHGFLAPELGRWAESQTIVVHNWARELREKTAPRR